MFPKSYELSSSIACLTFITLVEFSVIPVLHPIGFYCGDPKLSHKFHGDTVSVKKLLGVTLIAPLIAMFVLAFGMKKYLKDNVLCLRQAVAWYLEYLSGLVLAFTAVVFGKIVVGEPRPHFLDTCQPKEAFNCSSDYEYISVFECSSNVSTHRLQDACKSFPSGHAAFSFYMFIFFIRFPERRINSLKHSVKIFQWLCFLWAVFCALTRITDHRHHWWDVLIGTIIGCSLGYYAGSNTQHKTRSPTVIQ